MNILQERFFLYLVRTAPKIVLKSIGFFLLFVFELSIILTFLIFKNGFDDWKKSLKK